MSSRHLLSVSLLFAVLFAVGCQAAERPSIDDLGRKVKMKILVDKVMQPEAGWKTEEWMVKEAAAAGFNVFSPRRGAEDIAEVRKVTDWCRKYGMYHMPWMRGVQDIPKDKSLSDGKRTVWANGFEQVIWSPNSDELWQWMAEQIIPYAEISAKDPTMIGVFLDYENYWPGKQGNLYELSYDDVIMRKFAASKGITLPELALDKRKAWLEEQKLYEEFSKFQIAHWRQKCRELREAVDKLNPRFEFCIYPAPGTMFMLEACYPEWATKSAPLVLADPWTYGRPGRNLPHEASLKTNQKILERGMQIAKEKNINSIYIGGIDPVVNGADPEFSGKNALMLSGISDGYWIFYEGPKYKETHPEYFKWFAWANRKMDEGDFKAAWQPRETEDPFGFPKIKVTGQALGRTTPRDYPAVTLRGGNVMLVSGHKGTPVDMKFEVRKVGKNESGLNWEVRNEKWETVAKGAVEMTNPAPVGFTPAADGIYIMTLEAGGNGYVVKSSNVPLAIYTDPSVRLIYGAEKLYFKVPQGLQKFTLTSAGQPGETVKLTVSDAEGKEVGNVETTLEKTTVKLPVTVAAGQDGKVWSLSLGKATTGVLEDNSLTLDPALPQVLSYFADEIFEIGTKK